MNNNKNLYAKLIPVMLCFFAMGFVDLVGIDNVARALLASGFPRPHGQRSIQRIENERQQQELERKQKQTEILSLQMMQTLSTTIEAKDEYTRGHSHRVAEYAALIAAELGWSSEEIQQLKHAAYLHDIGKIGIPDLILNKPSRLTDDEYNLIKNIPSSVQKY